VHRPEKAWGAVVMVAGYDVMYAHSINRFVANKIEGDRSICSLQILFLLQPCKRSPLCVRMVGGWVWLTEEIEGVSKHRKEWRGGGAST
jgi:hypothetical protein